MSISQFVSDMNQPVSANCASICLPGAGKGSGWDWEIHRWYKVGGELKLKARNCEEEAESPRV